MCQAVRIFCFSVANLDTYKYGFNRRFTENVILQDFWISMFLANMVSLAKHEDDKEVKNARLNKDNKYEYQTNINTIIGSLRDKLAEAVFAKIRL